MSKLKIIAIFGVTLSTMFFMSNFAFAGSSPKWNKNASGTTYNIYKVIIACGKEYGHMCRRFEDPMGNINTPKKIILEEKKPIVSNINYNTTIRRKSYANVHSDFDVEKNAPKGVAMANRYYEFLESRARVAKYQRDMGLYGSQ